MPSKQESTVATQISYRICRFLSKSTSSPTPLNFWRNSKKPSLISSSTWGSSSFSLHTSSGSVNYYAAAMGDSICWSLTATPDASDGDMKRAFPCLFPGVLMLCLELYCARIGFVVAGPAIVKPWPMWEMPFGMPTLGLTDLKFAAARPRLLPAVPLL